MKTTVSAFANSLGSSWSEERILAEIAARAQHAGCTQDELLNAVALELARGFDQQALSHETAMEKAAVLYNAVFGHSEVPQHLYEVYWALDEAEYGSERDDPEEEHAPANRARKQVQAILAASLRDDA